jgi:hypothetical protein
MAKKLEYEEFKNKPLDAYVTIQPQIQALQFTDQDSAKHIIQNVNENDQSAEPVYEFNKDDRDILQIRIITDSEGSIMNPGDWLVWPQLSQCIVMPNHRFVKHYRSDFFCGRPFS